MNREDSEKRRRNGVVWKMENSYSITEGFTIDNLDTKSMPQASNDFERLFITIRKVLEKNDSYCMDNESERLQVCQALARKIKQNSKQIFEGRIKRSD